MREKLDINDGVQMMGLLQDYIDTYTLACVELQTDATEFKKDKIVKEIINLLNKYSDLILPNLSFAEYFKQSIVGGLMGDEPQVIIGEMATNHVKFIKEEVPKRISERMRVVQKGDSIINEVNNILKGESNGDNTKGTGNDSDSEGDTERGTDQSI